MCESNCISIVGLSISMIGALVMYCNSPINIDEIDGGKFTDDLEYEKKVIKRKNKFLKIGFFILFFGNLVQLLSFCF